MDAPDVSQDYNVDVKLVEVTPELADEWLSHNTKNRRVSEKYVRQYAKEMDRGNWEISPDCLAFDEEGDLINGQHRLRAVMESGVTELFLVAWGLPEDVFKFADQGRRRTAGQALRIEGYEYPSRLASLGKMVYNYEIGRLGSRHRVPTTENVRVVHLYDDSMLNSIRTCHKPSTRSTGLWRPSTIHFVHFVMKHRDDELAHEFVRGVGTSIGLEDENDPRYMLRTRLENEARRGNDRLGRRLEIALSIKACNAFFEGEELGRLLWAEGKGEDYPLPKHDGTYPFKYKEHEHEAS